MEQQDKFILGGHEFTSRFILGSGKYSLELIKAAVEHAGAQIVTMALRRVEAGQKDNILDYRMVTVSHNTIRGAAGGSILNGELLAKIKFRMN